MKPDKRLGQHFLRDGQVLEEIVLVADVLRSSGVLEIGPGEGALTAFLVRCGRPVVTIDADPRAIAEVESRFGCDVRAVLGDALEVDLEALLPPASADGRLPVVVGNLPYHVGSAILRKLLDLRGKAARLVVMLQREVARRVVGRPGSRHYGVPSVATALVADAWIVCEVPPEAFFPRPKVHSAVVLIEFRGRSLLGRDAREPFLAFVKTLFQSRRKLLRKALAASPDVLTSLGHDQGVRVEELDPNQLLALYRAVSESAR